MRPWDRESALIGMVGMSGRFFDLESEFLQPKCENQFSHACRILALDVVIFREQGANELKATWMPFHSDSFDVASDGGCERAEFSRHLLVGIAAQNQFDKGRVGKGAIFKVAKRAARRHTIKSPLTLIRPYIRLRERPASCGTLEVRRR